MSTDKELSILESAHAYSISIQSREIYLHGSLSDDEDNGVDHRQANRFLKNIRILEDKNHKKPIIIHQHSIGGDWSCGMMIFDAIVQCPCPIMIICHGEAASMGSIIPQAAVFHENAYRISMPHCTWLIHEGHIGLESTYREAKSFSKWNSTIMDQMIDIYIHSCKSGSKFEGYSDKKIKTYIDKQLSQKQDWWLNARESVEHGFTDAVMGDIGYESLQYIKDHQDSFWDIS